MDKSSRVRRRARRALLVEDNPDERSMYYARMSEAGWHVEAVASGANVLQAAISLSPDVIVTDLALPEMDGAEAMRKLRRDPRTEHVPVVVLTGFVERAREAYGAGCHTFLTKPCLPETLLVILDSIWEELCAADARRQQM